MLSDSIPAVNLSDISLSFRGGAIPVFRRLNFSVAAGDTVALTGPSGAGKTSLLAMIAGLLKPDDGRVETLGHSVVEMNEDELAAMRREKIGVVFQHFYLLDTMTAQENVALPLQLQGDKNARRRAAESLDDVGLGRRRAHFPGQLSGGERQRVAIARAFAARPSLLLADEPTGNLDMDTGELILQTLFTLAREHSITMLFATHNTHILNRFDKHRRLLDGKIRAEQ